MTTINYFITALLLFVSVAFSAQNNFIDYDRDTKWNFGLNFGGTWQENELDFINTAGFSGGLTLGRALYEKEGRLLSYDLRGRLLGGQTQGFSSVATNDSSLFALHTGGIGYKNYRFEYVEGSLELVVNAHRLRENTGVLLYAFGGVGLVSHSVNHNYKKGDVLYDYTTLDTTASKVAIAATLKEQFNDGSWEKENAFFTGSKTLFMPSLGIGLGYQVTPKVSIGLEHKVTFGLNDQLDGHLDGKNDRYHYTNFNIRWNLFRGNDRGTTPSIPEERPTPKPTVPIGNTNPPNTGSVDDYSTPSTEVVLGNKPLVNIMQPAIDGEKVFAEVYNLVAKVYYVAGKGNIVFKQNGIANRTFNYNAATNLLTATVVLTPGVNTFHITGTNNAGNHSDTKIINLEKKCNAPAITFTAPLVDGGTVTKATTTIAATIFNVSNASMLTFKHNGVANSNFSYNSTTNSFSATVNSVVGYNSIEITAKNECESKSSTRSFVFKEPNTQVFPPVVAFTNPSLSPFTTNANTILINGTVFNVTSANQIQMVVNGVATTSFSYDLNTKKISLTANLVLGANLILIKATNPYGVDTKSTTVIYKKEAQVYPPIVTYSYPASSPISVATNNITVSAKVLNVVAANQVQVLHNGTVIPNFNFNTATQEVTVSRNLVFGNNIFTIKGTNQAGVDQKETVVVFKKEAQVFPPVVTFLTPNITPYTTSNAKEVITARIENITSQAQLVLTFNGVNTSSFSYNATTKTVTFNAGLLLGINNLTITASNTAGVDAKNQAITRMLPCIAPTIDLQIPDEPQHNHVGRNGNMAFTFSTSNITSKNQVTLIGNGYAIPFNLEQANGNIWGTFPLQLGFNTLTVTVENNCGTATKEIQVMYKGEDGKQLPPVITIQTPNDFPYTTSLASVTVLGKVERVSSQSNIEVTMDGNPISFTYNTATKELVIPTVLTIGAHQVSVKAINNSGIVQEVFDLIRSGKQEKIPVINYFNLGASNSYKNAFVAPQANFTVRGKITNFQNTKVAVYINGNSFSAYTYNTATGDFSIPLVFTTQQKQVEVEVRATNSAGAAKKKAYLTSLTLVATAKPIGSVAVSSLYNEYIQKADEHFKSGEMELAKSYYEKAASANPEATYPKERLAEIAKNLKVIEEGQLELEQQELKQPLPSKPVERTINENKGGWTIKPDLAP